MGQVHPCERAIAIVTAPNPEFWAGKRVLVTGHTGFKGSWLSLWLHRLGADVTGLALDPPTEPSLFQAAEVGACVESLIADVRDRRAVVEAFDRCRPQIVFHLAGQALVGHAYDNPVGTYGTNVMGTANVVETARDRPELRSLVAITSDKCYRNRGWRRAYRESDELGGRDPYSASKAAAELVIRSFRESWFDGTAVGLASVRAGNVIGGGDWAPGRLIPDIMRALAARETVQIRRPQATRPWQHVLEALSGYLVLAEQLWGDPARASTAWNVGPDTDQCRPVEWIVEHLTSAWGGGAAWARDGEEFPHEDTFLRLDCRKIEKELGWRPALDLATALDWIVAWYRDSHRGQHPRDITLAQIERYQEVREGAVVQVA